ncbi:non-ribosomal peptide synthetase [Streptomyces sp. NPDC051001]|uniref:non-ribosomal peptide synthetase n=1 Tax=Streptomyces sp. NPDC051001 TaxID=3155795 RepID=UPI0034456FA9
MAVEHPRVTVDEIPTRLPIGTLCPADQRCAGARRSLRVAHTDLPDRRRDLAVEVLGAVLLLARRYGDSTTFRIGVRPGSRTASAGNFDVTSELPSDATISEHLASVAAALTAADAVNHPAQEPQPGLLCAQGPVTPADAQRFPLVVSFTDTAEHLELHLDHHEHVVDTAGADRMLGHLALLLAQLRGPERRLREVRMLTGPELELLHTWNDTRRSYPREASVWELFAQQADEGPQRVAVADEDRTLTYAQLREQALELASRLHGLGVRRGSRVAVQLTKSPWVLVTVLAVLRLGAAYVPIGMEAPAKRRDLLLDDSGCDLLVVDTDSGAARVPVVDLRTPAPSTGQGPLPVPHSAPEDIAYIMYTSGTTGTPKGVPIPHRAVIRLVRNTDYASLTPDTVILQTGALAFDATTFEYWGALLNGGAVVLLPTDTVLDAARLAGAVRRHGVTDLFLTTALFHQLVDQDPAALDGCRVLVGGEALSPRHVAAATAACPHSEFRNIYGPTENTTFSLSHLITRPEADGIPLGRPIANSTAYVMDRDGNPQPIGVPGEIWVGGDGLGTGYLNRPELTREVFVSGGPAESAPLYRTGDLGRWDGQGRIDYLGRTDHQVKIRGYRVELAEVESHVRRRPEVSDAVVLLRRDADGTPALCAYYTAADPVAHGTLRAALAAELPEYMVPTRYWQLDTMPLNRNHKIDRAALAALDTSDESRSPTGGRPPRGALETGIAAVYADVLGLPSVTADDDFFDLGGHSLLAIKLWSRIRAELDREFDLRQVMDTPTVAGLAAALQQVETGARQARPKLARRTA